MKATTILDVLRSDELTRIQIRPARLGDIGRIYDIARQLIAPDVALPAVFERIYRRNRFSLLVVDEGMDADRDADNDNENGTAVTGFIATLPLSAEGENALRGGTFCGKTVRSEWVAPEGKEPNAVHIWGLAGLTPKAKASIWKSALFIERCLYPHVPYYATAGTQTGRKLLERLGYFRLRDTIASVPENLFGRTSHMTHSAAA